MYINKETGIYPYTEQTIKKLYPNISFGTPFEAPEPFAKVVEVTAPINTDDLKIVIELQPALVDGKYVQVYSIIDRFQDTEEKTKAEQEAEYLEAKRKASVPKTITKLQAMKQMKVISKWEAFKAVLANDEDVNDEWLLSDNLNRTYPLVLGIGQLFGFTDDDMDTFFIEADKLS